MSGQLGLLSRLVRLHEMVPSLPPALHLLLLGLALVSMLGSYLVLGVVLPVGIAFVVAASWRLRHAGPFGGVGLLLVALTMTGAIAAGLVVGVGAGLVPRFFVVPWALVAAGLCVWLVRRSVPACRPAPRS